MYLLALCLRQVIELLHVRVSLYVKWWDIEFDIKLKYKEIKSPKPGVEPLCFTASQVTVFSIHFVHFCFISLIFVVWKLHADEPWYSFFFFFHLLFWALTRYLHSRIACTLLPRNFIFLIISSFPFSVFTLFIASYNRIRLLIFQKNFLLIFHLSMFIFSFAGRRGGRVGSCALALGSSWAGDHTQSTAVISLDP